MTLVKEIREFQNEMNLMLNTFCDKLVLEAEKLEKDELPIKDYIAKYPLANASVFKGKKPVNVIVNNQQYECPTWKKVVETVLKEAIKDETMKQRLLALRDIVMGRKRKRVSASSDDMTSPLLISDDLYIETHYDTEALIKLLIQLLTDIRYDYNDIQVTIRN